MLANLGSVAAFIALLVWSYISMLYIHIYRVHAQTVHYCAIVVYFIGRKEQYMGNDVQSHTHRTTRAFLS